MSLAMKAIYPMNEERHRILVVEDETITAMAIRSCLEAAGYVVTGTVPSGEKALANMTKHNPDLVLMDIMLKDALDGIETARRIRSESDVPIVFLTAFGDKATKERAQDVRPFGFIIKPFHEKMLLDTVKQAFRRPRKASPDLASETVEFVTNTFKMQIAIAASRRSSEIKDCLRGCYPLGYLYGFCFSALEVLGIRDEERKLALALDIFANLFDESSSELLATACLLREGNEVFIEGQKRGREDWEAVHHENKPAMGLVVHLLELAVQPPRPQNATGQ